MPNVGLETVDWDCVNKKTDACYHAKPPLKVLNLHSNALTGNAPDFSTFCALEILDLSHNKFGGKFPTFEHGAPVPNPKGLKNCYEKL